MMAEPLATPTAAGSGLAGAGDPAGSGRRSRWARWAYWVLPLTILGVAALLRLSALDADPPSTLSQDYVSDESWWAHNARNHALFGRWRLDDFNQGMFAAPLHTVLERLSFAVGGIHLRQTRLVSALAGLATIGLIGWLMRREVGLRGALAAMGILATDYFTASYDRAAFVEPLPTAFMSLSLVLVTTRRRGWIWLALAGVAADMACLSKVNSVFFLAAPFIWTLIRPRRAGEPRTRLGDAAVLLAGMAVPLAVFGATFVLPNLGEYFSQNGRLRDESKVRGMMAFLNIFTITIQGGKTGLTFSGFLTQALLPTTLGLLWFLHAGSQAARHGFRAMLRNLTSAERLALLWIGAFLPYFVMQDNSQDRRYYVFVAPLTILAAHILAVRRGERIELQTFDLRTTRALIVLAACFLAAALYLRVPLAAALNDALKDVAIGEQPGLSKITISFLATGLSALIALPALWIILRKLPRSSLTAVTAALIIAVVGGSLQLARFARAASTLSYSVSEASRKFVAQLEPEARVIDGHPLIMETRCRNLILLDRSPLGYPFYGMGCLDEFRPTHWMISGPAAVDQATYDRRLREVFGDRYRSIPGSLATFESCPDDQGKMRMVFTLGRIAPGARQYAAH